MELKNGEIHDILSIDLEGGRFMLLEFTCSNHKSIGEKIVFSTLAGKDNSHNKELILFERNRIVKSAVIYGANGSGKSNLIDAISFVKNLVVQSIRHQPGDGIRQIPHKLLGIERDSEYTLQFVTKNVRYAYGFTLCKTLIVDEYLYYFPNGKQVKIFERSAEGYTEGNQFKGRFDSCKDVLKPNRLFLSCAANFSNVREVEASFRFFKDELVIYSGLGIDNWMEYSLRQMHENENIKKTAIRFMQSLDTGIKDIIIKVDQKTLKESELPSFLSVEFKTILVRKVTNSVTAKVVYDQFEVDLMSEESTGIRKLFEFICPMIDIVSNGKVLVCDELEANFHESIMYGLVNLFRKLNRTPSAQMIFTTHDTSVLSLDLFRRDQIWFTELTRDTRETDLYSLAEIKNVRKDENIGKGYIAGKYGAIPMLNENLANIIQEFSEEVENGN